MIFGGKTQIIFSKNKMVKQFLLQNPKSHRKIEEIYCPSLINKFARKNVKKVKKVKKFRIL